MEKGGQFVAALGSHWVICGKFKTNGRGNV